MHTETGALAAGGQRSSAISSTNLAGSQLSFSYHQSLRDLEHDVPTEILPGTEIMGDIGDYHFTKRGRNNTVLVPQPSNDPNDPLNWSPLWKLSAMASATIVTFAQGIGPLANAPIFPQLIQEYHSDLAGVVQFTGVTILVLGFSNFLWVPLSDTFGRRFVLVTSTLLCLASYAWRAEATSYSSFMGASILNGIGAGPAEALQPTIIADILFLHERGLYNTLYFVTFYGSVMIGPIISGAMALSVGWRNFYWLNVAILAFAVIAVLVGFPETKWRRPAANEILITTPTQTPDSPSKDMAIEKQDDSSGSGSGNVNTVAEADLGKSKPAKWQWKLLQPAENPFKSLLVEFLVPWQLLLYPIVIFASLIVAFSSTCYLMVNYVQSEGLAAPPYLFSTQAVGFTNFASLVGALLGLFTAGPASDYVSAALTKRNKGIREPEMRLVTMIPYVLIMILGNFMVGYGFQNSWNWRIIVIIGFTCAGIQIAALPAIAATYAVDCYKPASGAIFISITLYKNIWGYGVSKYFTPWVLKGGYVPPFMTNMSLTLLWCGCGAVFWIWGKNFRRWTAKSMVHNI